ncbi:MAG: hypothetical protein HFE76_15975 [Firmicutes bacterium]|nr:hypothetical protein [Bacillota bacterium]
MRWTKRIKRAREWRQFVRAFQNSIDKARSFQNQQQQKIVLGFIDSSAHVDAMISSAILEYKRICPQVDIVVEKHDN